MEHDPALTDELARHFLAKAYRSADPPFDDAAWLRGAYASLERANTPHQIANKVMHLRAKAAGKSLTYCREVRGSHAISYVWSEDGCDPTPPGWRGYAVEKAAEEAYRARQ